jgi:hypothetical protein
MAIAKRFSGILERLPGNLGWTIVRLPFDATKVWKERNRLRVKGAVNGFAFRTSSFSTGDGAGQFLLINKKMQVGANVTLGDLATIVIEPDLEERTPMLPPELAKLLKQDRELRRFYESLSPSMRNDIAKYLSEPKSPNARTRRAGQLAERMLLALEGEDEPPPILQIVFRRLPGAEAGWKAMTPVQRRSHLLGIFYYQSPEAREKRALKAAEEALKLAKARNLVPER